MKVLIVGGGIGGLALAAFLEEAGLDYEIAEKATDWDRQGFIISIWDNGRRILQKLGLAEQFDAQGSRVTSFSVRNGKGESIKKYDLTTFLGEFGGAVTLVSRSMLHDLLLTKVDRAKIRMNRTVASLRQERNGVHVTFSDQEEKKYDIVVGADGIHSSIRQQLFPKTKESYQDWRIWCAWIDKKFATPATIAEYAEAGELAIIFSAADKAMTWFMAPIDHAIWDETVGRVDRLKTLFKDETSLLEMFNNMRDEEVLPTDLIEIRLPRWSSGNVTLLGDAAHGVGPYTGIGGSMAMEDAYILAGELLQVTENITISTALQRYEKKRKKRLRVVEMLNGKIKMGVLVKYQLERQLLNFFIKPSPQDFLRDDYRRLLREEL